LPLVSSSPFRYFVRESLSTGDNDAVSIPASASSGEASRPAPTAAGAAALKPASNSPGIANYLAFFLLGFFSEGALRDISFSMSAAASATPPGPRR
jgi:hypothetical protein